MAISSRASPGAVERLAASLHAPLAARYRAVGLAPTRRGWKNDLGELPGLRQEDILNDQVPQTSQQLDRMLLIGLRLRRILADDVERVELFAIDRREHVGEVPAVLLWQRGVPGALELCTVRRVLDVLAARKLVRNRTHVAAALHVILSAQRTEPAAVTPDVAAEQREVDQRANVVDGVVVLGDAERPAELGARRFRVRVRELANQRRAGTPVVRCAYSSV